MPPPLERGRLVRSGSTLVRCGELTETECAVLPDPKLLRERLHRDGYLFCRSLISRDDILAARHAIFDAVGIKDSSAALCMPSLLDRQDVAALPAVQRVLESRRVAALLLRAVTGGAKVQRRQFTPVPFKWLRAVPPGLFTGVHMDRVYFPDFDLSTHTTWLPLGDCPVESGSMLVCEGAHRFGHIRYDRLRCEYLEGRKAAGTRAAGNGTDNGWWCEDALQIVRECSPGVRWLTADMHAGDVLVLPLETLHTTAVNTTSAYRVSADVRWTLQDSEQTRKRRRT